MDLLLHDQTKKNLDDFIKHPHHALCLSGPVGSGKPTVANHIARQLLAVTSLTNYPYYLHIAPEGTSISIEAIRNLQNFVSLKTAGDNDIRRIALIEDADSLTTEAQNALLKILEEPPIDTVIILTVSKPSQLLPTIYSRCQTITLRSPSQTAASAYFDAYNESDVAKAYLVSSGSVGLMSALLNDKEGHALKADIELAKKLLGMPAFDRLLEVDKLAKEKGNLPSLLYALARVYRAVLEQGARKNKITEVRVAHKALQTILSAQKNLHAGASPKLLLDDLFLNL